LSNLSFGFPGEGGSQQTTLATLFICSAFLSFLPTKPTNGKAASAVWVVRLFSRQEKDV
jgi:hypothetical protein